MLLRRAGRKRLGVLAICLVLAAGVACKAEPSSDEVSKFTLAAFCLVNKKASTQPEVIPAELSNVVVQWPTGGCIRLWPLPEERPYSSPQLIKIFPEISRAEIDTFSEFGVVACPGRAATAFALTGAKGSLPPAVTLETATKEACGKHPGPSLAGRPGWGAPAGGGPGLPGLSLSTPSSSSIKCSSGIPNPYAQSSGSSYDNYNRPANEAREELTKELGGWLGGPGGLGFVVGRGSPQATAYGIGIGAVGKAVDLAINTEKRVGEIAKYMWEEAISVAKGAANHANESAAAAAAAAAAAESLAGQNPNNAALQQTAKDARAAANSAQAAATKAQAAAAKTASQFTGAGSSTQEAKRAAADAARAREEAEKKRKQAEDQAKGGSSAGAGPTQGAPTRQPGPNSSNDIKGCDSLRSFIWECGQAGWKTFACQEFLWKANKCKGDLTVLMPTDDGYQCAGSAPDVDPALVRSIIETMCRKTTKPAPGEDPCGAAVATLTGEIRHHPGCDPTIAFTEKGGCTVAPQAVVEVKQFCPPSPPDVPPLPCGDEGPPLPPMAAMKSYLEASQPFVYSVQGFGTLSSRDTQLIVDQGGGYSTAFVFYGFNAELD